MVVAVDTRAGVRRAGRRRAETGDAQAPDKQRLPRSRVREVGTYHRATMPAGKALIVMLIALLFGGLLNVRSLTEGAERQPFGLKRDASMVLIWPFQQVSGALGLDQPRVLLTERLGREVDAGAAGEELLVDNPDGGDVAVDADGNPVNPVAADVLAVAAALAGREAIDPSIADVVAIPADLDPDAPDVQAAALSPRLARTFSTEDPLRIAVVGDSLTEQLGPAIIDRTERPGVLATTTHDFTYSSGLTRPDFYDWPAKIADLTDTVDPDLWIVMLGANDAQDVRDADDRFRHIGSDEWESIYTSRIAGLMDQMTDDGRAVIWVGQPIMRDAEFDESMEYISELYRRQAGARSYVSYVDARQVFDDASGAYADYLTEPDGQLAQMRLGDGIHLTRAGASRLAEQILPLLPIVTNPDVQAVVAD